MNSLQHSVLEKVESCYQDAEQAFNTSFPRPNVNFKLSGKCAGVAHLYQNTLRFNLQLLNENGQAFIDQVVPHEICHLLCHLLYGKVRPHGKEWQALMLGLFQVQPKTTHNFPVTTRNRQQFTYYCHCGLVQLSSIRHNKIIRNEASYRCKKCYQVLAPEKN
ncbi:MAG: SprT family zinc-dependent metalloprotease [Parashewanella sp.]